MTLPLCPLCGSDRLRQWDLADPWVCGNCGAEVRGPIPVTDVPNHADPRLIDYLEGTPHKHWWQWW
jgi:ribosomal protein L37AE/L43A